MLPMSPNKMMASMVEKGCDYPCLDRGSRTFFEASDEVGKGCDVEHFDLREWKKGSETISLLSLLREKQRNVREKKEQKRKKHKNTC